MRKIIALYRGLRAFTTIVRDPNQLGMVFSLLDSIEADPKVFQTLEHYFRSHPKTAAGLVAQRRIGLVKLDELRTMPVGTLGYETARYFDNQKLDPAALPQLKSQTTQEYIKAHLYETHDIWHVITGFHTDVAGELGLQAFYLAQFPAFLASAILAAGLLNTMFKAMDDKDHRMNEIARGWFMGKKAEPLFGFDWSAHWLTPLHTLRAQLGIEPSPEQTTTVELQNHQVTSQFSASA